MKKPISSWSSHQLATSERYWFLGAACHQVSP